MFNRNLYSYIIILILAWIFIKKILEREYFRDFSLSFIISIYHLYYLGGVLDWDFERIFWQKQSWRF